MSYLQGLKERKDVEKKVGKLSSENKKNWLGATEIADGQVPRGG